MKMLHHGDTLHISGVKELGATNSQWFQNAVRAALPFPIRTIDIDLSETSFVDIGGLGALMAVHKAARDRNKNFTIRLINPTPSVQQLLELTRVYQIFEIVKETRTQATANQ